MKKLALLLVPLFLPGGKNHTLLPDDISGSADAVALQSNGKQALGVHRLTPGAYALKVMRGGRAYARRWLRLGLIRPHQHHVIMCPPG